MGDNQFDDMNAIMKNMGLCFVYMLSHFMVPYTFVFIFAIMILYGSKVYQAGLIPLDVNCYPYTNLGPVKINRYPQVNVNKSKTKEGEEKAEHIVFDYFRERPPDPKEKISDVPTEVDYTLLMGKFIRGIYRQPEGPNDDNFRPPGSMTFWFAFFIMNFVS